MLGSKLTSLILTFWTLTPPVPVPGPERHATAEQISEAIVLASHAHRVAPALLAAVAEHESRYNPRAISRTGD